MPVSRDYLMRRDVRKLLGGLLLAAMAMTAGAAEVEVPVIENAGYTFCVNEAIDALWVGRLPIVFGRTREQLQGDPSLPPYLRGMVADFFADQAAGRAPTHAHFALHRFRDCLGRQQMALDQIPEEQTFACLARMDIPFFYFVLRRSGETREAATVRIQSTLAGWNYPQGLVALLAEPSWNLGSEPELRELQGFLFNSCMLPPAMVSAYYGMTPPAAGSAPAAGAPARATPPGGVRK